MALLLDTHTFLWFISGNRLLPVSLKNKIEDIQQPCFISIASLWETTIKQQLGKLTLEMSLTELFEFIDKNQIEVIPINYTHLLTLTDLPDHHSDPFDRLIISQAMTENLELISKDKVFKNYDVRLSWS